MVKTIITKLEKELNLEKSRDFIGNLFDERIEIMFKEICNTEDYKKHIKRLNNFDKKIKTQFQNETPELLKLIDEYVDMAFSNGFILEKLMYKYGISDGIKFVTEETKNIDTKNS